MTDEAVKFINGHQEVPFLMYLSYYTVHTPLEAKREKIEKYRKNAERLHSTVQSVAIFPDHHLPHGPIRIILFTLPWLKAWTKVWVG